MKNAIIAIMMIAATVVSAAAECSDADKKALIEFDKGWTAANLSGERGAIAAFYADEFMAFPSLVDKNGAINAAVATFERNKANPQAVATTVTDHYQIICTPLTATMIHRNITTPAGGGQPTHGRSVHFLERRNGKWVAIANAPGGLLNDTDMLRYMELDWINAVRSRDFDWMEKNYANDFTEVSFISGAVNNKRQTIDALKADRTVFDSMEVSDLNIRIDGNTGVVIGVGHARGKGANAKPFDIKLRFTDTYIKRDGRWLAWASQATMVPASQNVAGN